MKRARSLALFLSLLCMFGAVAAKAQNVLTITVTNVATNITVNQDCYFVQVRENSATPTAAFDLTFAGSSVVHHYAAGTIYTFAATKRGGGPSPGGGPFKSGTVIGTIVATTAGPFTFTGDEFYGDPSLVAKNATGGGTTYAGLSSDGTTLDFTGAGGGNFSGPVSAGNDGVHPGSVNLVGNTTLPMLAANTVTLFGPPSASATAWSWQVPTALPPNGYLLSCVVTGTNCLLTPVAASGGAYSISKGATAAITQTGSYVTIFSQASVPALAAGACYTIEFALSTPNSISFTAEIHVDSTVIGAVGPGAAEAYYMQGFEYCNNAAVQNAQTLSYLYGGFNTTNVANTGVTNYTGVASFSTPTAVDWSTTHTISILTNGASSTVTGLSFRVRG